MKFFIVFLCFFFWMGYFANAAAPSPGDTTVPRHTMTSLRTATPPGLSGNVFITDGGRQGFFAEAPGDSQTPDDSSMTLVTGRGVRYKRVTVDGVVDARWFGAIPGDGKDDWEAIQKAVNFCTAHGDKYTTVHLSPGLYLISQPILLYYWGGTGYGFHSTGLEGESSFWESSGNGTVIQCTFKDKFAIGIELGKGNRIRKLRILGGFKPPFTNKFNFYHSSFEQFTDPSCRDQNFSPYAGIVIDPFSNSATQIPADGGYPGYTSWYRGAGGVNGSTGISIEDVSINGFVVGICSSPNSFTRNAELTYINKVQFADMKLCIAGSQEQEKGNVVSNLGCWGTVHTVFATGLYGAHTPGNWYVENANIAGYVNRLIYNPQSGYFASHFKNIFSESLGRLGTIYSSQGTIMEASELGFAYYTEHTGEYVSPEIDCSGVTFIGCNFRMYGTFKPVTINGSSTFIGCSFEAVPFADYVTGNYPSFVHCNIGGYTNLLGVTGVYNMYPIDAWKSYAYGNYSISRMAATLKIDNARPAAAYPLDLSGATTALKITEAGGIRSATVALSPEQSGRVRSGDIICTNPEDRTQGVIGTVTAVTPTGFTISYIPSWVVSGQGYYLSIFLPLHNMTFLGDMTAGSKQITNVQIDFGNMNEFVARGGLMFCNKFVNTRAKEEWRASLFRIVAYDAATRTVTLDQQATMTTPGVYFSNGNAIKEVHVEDYTDGFSYLDVHDANELLQDGGRLFTRDASSGRTVTYRVTRSGFYNAKVTHDPRQAEWVREDLAR